MLEFAYKVPLIPLVLDVLVKIKLQTVFGILQKKYHRFQLHIRSRDVTFSQTYLPRSRLKIFLPG